MKEGDPFAVPIHYGPETEGGSGGTSAKKPWHEQPGPVKVGGSFVPVNKATGKAFDIEQRTDARGNVLPNEFINRMVTDPDPNTYPEELKSTDLQTPLGHICDVFKDLAIHRDASNEFRSTQEIKTAIALHIEGAQKALKGATEKDKRDITAEIARFKAVEDTYLPMLKNALERWLGTPAYGDGVSLEGIYKAFRSVSRGERTPKLLAPVMIKETTFWNDTNRHAAVRALEKNEIFEGVIGTLSATSLDVIAEKKIRSTEETEIRHKVLDDVAKILRMRGLLDEKLRPLNAAIESNNSLGSDEKKEERAKTLRNLVWGDNPPTLSDLIKLKNRAHAIATGSGTHNVQGHGHLTEVFYQFLTKLHPSKESGASGSAHALLLMNYGNVSLTPSMPALARSSAQEFYRRHAFKRDTIVLDASFKREVRGADGSTRAVFASIGEPISWLAAATHPGYQVAGETKEERAEVIEREAKNLRETLRHLIDWFAAKNRVVLNEKDPRMTGQVWIDRITPEFIEQVGATTTSVANDEKAGLAADLEGGPKAPDEFARIQKIFTDTLFSTLKNENGKTLLDFLQFVPKLSTQPTPLENIYVTGLWCSEELESRLRSYDIKSEVATKRFHVELFLGRLEEIAKRVEEMAQFGGNRLHQARIRVCALAIKEIAQDIRIGRLTESGSKRETAKMYENFAHAFRVLVGYGILERLPEAITYPERRVVLDEGENMTEAQSESEEEYDARLRLFIEANNKSKEEARAIFRDKQAVIVVRNLHEILQRIDATSDDKFRENFLPQISEVLNKKMSDDKRTGTKGMLSLVGEKIGEIERRETPSPLVSAFADNIAPQLDNVLFGADAGKASLDALRGEWRKVCEGIAGVKAQDADDYFDAKVRDWFALLPGAERMHFEKLRDAVRGVEDLIQKEYETGLQKIRDTIGFARRLPGGAALKNQDFDPVALHPKFLNDKADLEKIGGSISHSLTAIRRLIENDAPHRERADGSPAARLASDIHARYASVSNRYSVLRAELTRAELFFKERVIKTEIEDVDAQLARLATEPGKSTEREIAQTHRATLAEKQAAFEEMRRIREEKRQAEDEMFDRQFRFDIASGDPDATEETVKAEKGSLEAAAQRLKDLKNQEEAAQEKAQKTYDITIPAFEQRNAEAVAKVLEKREEEIKKARSIEQQREKLETEALTLNEEIDAINDEIDAAIDERNTSAEQTARDREKVARDKLEDVLNRLNVLESRQNL